MSGLSQRRGVLGIAVIALGALLVLAVNVISGRAVDGVAAPGPPPPVPAAGSCLKLTGSQRWVPANCRTPYQATVHQAWRTSTAPAAQGAAPGNCPAPRQYAPSAPTIDESGVRWLPPYVPWTPLTVAAGGAGGWTACVAVAYVLDRKNDADLRDLAIFTVPPDELTSTAQLPASLRRCYAGSAPVLLDPAAAPLRQSQVPCHRPHQWELLAAAEPASFSNTIAEKMNDGAGGQSATGPADRQAASSAGSCRKLADVLLGNGRRLDEPDAPGIVVQLAADGEASSSVSFEVPAGAPDGMFRLSTTAVPPGCYLVAPQDKYLTASVVGLGNRPFPYRR